MSNNSLLEKIVGKLSYRFYPIYRWHEKKIGFHPARISTQSPTFQAAEGRRLDPQAILDDLVRDGVVAIENFYPSQYIDSLARQCAEQVRKYEQKTLPTAKLFEKKFGYDQALLNEGTLRMYDIDKVVPETARFRDDPLPKFIGEQYYGRSLRLETTLFQHNFVCEKGTRNWHIDSWVNQLKSFLYLTDVEPGNGPFTYLLGSHRNDDFLLKKTFSCLHGKETTDVSEQSVQSLGLKTKEFYAKKGTLIIADTKGVHQGGTLKHGTRSVLVNYFYV